MELVGLIRYLAQTVSPGEFLVVVCVGILMIFFGIKYGITILTRGKKLMNVFTEDTSNFDEISKQLGSLVTDEQLGRATSEQKRHLDDIVVLLKEQLSISRELLAQHAVIKQQQDDIFREIHEDVELLSVQLKDVASHMQMDHTVLKVDLSKNQELCVRVITQLEKMDEFAKASVPEVRSSFKEVINDLKTLQRDVALIEQLQKMHINTPGIKLK